MLRWPAAAMLLASFARAEDAVELKWTIAEGDRFALEVSLDASSETRDPDGAWETTRTLKLSATLEVVETGADDARVELRILRTSGRSRFKDGDIEDTPLDSEARDWRPIAATLTKSGELRIDLLALAQNPKVVIADSLMQLFPPLPGGAVARKATWPGLDTANVETLSLAGVSRKAGRVEAAVEGRSGSEEKIPAAAGEKAGTRTTQGTSTCVFDVTDGSLRSALVQLTTERRVQGKQKPVQTQTWRRTVTVARLKSGK